MSRNDKSLILDFAKPKRAMMSMLMQLSVVSNPAKELTDCDSTIANDVLTLGILIR